MDAFRVIALFGGIVYVVLMGEAYLARETQTMFLYGVYAAIAFLAAFV